MLDNPQDQSGMTGPFSPEETARLLDAAPVGSLYQDLVSGTLWRKSHNNQWLRVESPHKPR